MAHKKAAGSAKNLRDSKPKYRGLKLAGGQFARAGNIIIRQKGDKYQLGLGVYKGKDFTIHAKYDGVVFFRKKKFVRYDGRKYLKTVVDVLPVQDEVLRKHGIVKKNHDKKPISPKQEKDIVIDGLKKKKEQHDSSQPKDNLSMLEGINDTMAKVLYDAGICSFADLSLAKVADLRKLMENVDEKDRGIYDPKLRKKQATLAKNGKMDALNALQEEMKKGVL